MVHRSRLVAWALLGTWCSLGWACSRNNQSSGGTDAGSGSASAGRDAGPIKAPQPVSPFIVVDQFGYRSAAEKIAVLRNPIAGFDKGKAYFPAAKYVIVDARSRARVLEAAPQPWNGGATDGSSGDKAWWLDFSSVTAVGDYFVLDETAWVRSPIFHIGDDVYDGVLTQSMRMFYYQRDGIAKDAKYAGADWADGVAHPQDAKCALYSDGSGVRDLHGGWFDAGDQNRYTNWTASDVIELLRAYVENRAPFGDATNIPESGNGVPDLLDEVKWGLDWLVRMQNADGSVLSIAGHQGASPPSTDASPCKYGPASTSATLTTAAAFAFASRVYGSVASVGTAYPGFASDLGTRAQKAWTWAVAHPSVTFSNAGKVASGEQEVDDDGRLQKKVQAAVFLFELTGDATYQSVVDASYAALLSSFDPFHIEQLDAALEYTKAQGATAPVSSAILAAFKSGVEGEGYLGALKSNPDPYMAQLQIYTWGSNQVKAAQGTMFTDVVTFAVDGVANARAMRAAERYVHYVHGVNPLQLVYLSNMPGATKSVTRLFHSWFAEGSRWDVAGVSKYGPPPGYLVGGPNPKYDWNACCPSKCGNLASNTKCGRAAPSPPTGQPDQKSYLDFNSGWPLDSWEITEPDDAYQAKWVRLLSKFVK
ncbi:MAG TPA: glycoside hydrolase family 9 protein [Polyangiaceae bacterium]|nr:glycoside hydrolase family 9 protein [Polyangiaceae bacterium]